jgi:hypothetical protein
MLRGRGVSRREAGGPARSRRTAAAGPIRLPPARRYGVYAVCFGIWATGAAWLVLHDFMRRQGPFGPENHPLEPWALKLHGAFAFATLWTLGMLWVAHIVNGWQAHRRRASGAVLLGFALFLVATGWLLYYAGGDELRGQVALLHWSVGLAAPVALGLHRLFHPADRREGDRREKESGRKRRSRTPETPR